ncbi:hypothetical protein C2I19_09300 [Chromobacterium alticapitis]|uniref:Transposase n=1 Tax=Chromobacterium alticapitis TaxID=2073169 RepID=A0A2S5DH78_9NEIS|nr:hypothetical protein C2I19_09300 [Chromobacterium alticapitis]
MRRRDWPDDVKASIAVESFSSGKTTRAVARQHVLGPS